MAERMKSLEIEINGRIKKGWAQKLRGELWFHLDGETFCLAADVKTRAKKAALNTREILAPMPGKVTKILKTVGSQINTGDVLVVLEAMKMEYNLEAQTAGQIKKINCVAGDQVTLNSLLVEIEPKGDSNG
jgi:acetyl/propionyl-CoA carboxylase alpha subunit